MEYTQWVMGLPAMTTSSSLNPCCNGIYSMRRLVSSFHANIGVLILVVMEYTQWDRSICANGEVVSLS